MTNRVEQVFYEKTTDGDSSLFTASAKNLNKTNNKIGILLYGVFDNAIVKLQGRPAKTELEQTRTPFILKDRLGADIEFKEKSIQAIELLSQMDYNLVISGSGGSTSISAQIIYDEVI